MSSADLVRTGLGDPTYSGDMTNKRIPNDPWPPIPDHAIEIAGRPMLPERLTEVDGKPYVRCYLHGLIPADHRCEQSPGDHFCGVAAHPNHLEGEDHDDQGCSHDEWTHTLTDRVFAIADLHQQGTIEGGGTSGYCAECSWQWPCATAHVAHGWGDYHDCEDAGWCRHAGVPLTPAEVPLIDGGDGGG